MDRRNFFIGAAAMLPVAASAQAPTLRDRVLGAWRILDAETVNVATGARGPWRDRPRPYSGIIMYLPNGLMSVQIGAARPNARAGATFDSLSDEEARSYFETWYAYYGRFEVDEEKSQVRHFVEGSLFAFETGVTLVRTLRLEDDVLTLRTVNLLNGPAGETFNELTWARL
jgi:hypothetical protein